MRKNWNSMIIRREPQEEEPTTDDKLEWEVEAIENGNGDLIGFVVVPAFDNDDDWEEEERAPRRRAT